MVTERQGSILLSALFAFLLLAITYYVGEKVDRLTKVFEKVSIQLETVERALAQWVAPPPQE